MTENKKVYSVIIIIMVAISSVVIGYATASQGSVLEFRSLFSGCETTADIWDTAFKACLSTFIQALVVFVSAFTMFTLPICAVVLVYRWGCLSYCIFAFQMITKIEYLPFVASYLLVTLLISFLTYKCLEFSSEAKHHRTDYKYLVPSALNLGYSFLTVGGACIVMRIIPHLII